MEYLIEEDSVKKANFGPLGLLGFGLTTLLLNLHNVGAFELNIVVLAMGIAFGGLAQLVAGIFELRQGNTFGGTVFVGYSLFWWSTVIIWVLPFGEPANNVAMGCYLLAWALFTLIFFVCSAKHNTITKLVFGTLTLLFVLLAIADFSGEEWILRVAGAVGIICALSSIYSAAAQMINGEFDRDIMPM